MKIIHNGKQYDIGSLYETETGFGKLTGLNTEEECFEILNNGQHTYYSTIHEIKSELGTITDAPIGLIELEEGCWYMCEVNSSGSRCPLYWDGEVLTTHTDTRGMSCGHAITDRSGIKVLFPLGEVK